MHPYAGTHEYIYLRTHTHTYTQAHTRAQTHTQRHPFAPGAAGVVIWVDNAAF